MEATYVSSKRVSRSSSKDGGPEQYLADQSSSTTNGSIGNTSFSYKSTITPRSLIIQRNALGINANNTSPVSGTYTNRQRVTTSQYTPSVNSFALLSNTGVNVVKQSSDKEKKDMQDLNERFASYIEKVRFLEAQNRKLTDELERLKAKWGKETTQIKAMYQAELDEARKVLDDATREKARLEIRVASLEENRDETMQRLYDSNQELAKSREVIETLNQQVACNEADLNLLRRRIDGLESDRERDKKTIVNLQESLNRARIDLDQETLMHIDAENRRQTIEEEIEFLKTIHEQEMKELAALAYRDSTAENREFWKTEMGQAMREIQNIYDEKLNVMRGELEGFYNLKIQEFRTGATRQSIENSHTKEESKRLRNQFTDLKDRLVDLESKNAQLLRDLDNVRREAEVREKELYDENESLKIELAKLRAEMDSMLTELQSIMDTKLGLELEIAAYRKLLEGEENRVGLKNIVDGLTMGNYAGSEYGGASSYSSGSGGVASYSVGGSSAYGGVTDSFSSRSGNAGGGISSYTVSSGSNTITLTGGVNGGVNNGSSVGMQSFTNSTQDTSSLSKSLKGELSSKTTFHKNSKGPVALWECPQDGKYILVDNNSRKSENIGGWKIVRTIDNNKVVEYTFKEGFIIEPASKYKVWAQASKPDILGDHDLEFDEDSWGVGANVTTRLFNTNGEERAIYTQKTTYM